MGDYIKQKHSMDLDLYRQTDEPTVAMVQATAEGGRSTHARSAPTQGPLLCNLHIALLLQVTSLPKHHHLPVPSLMSAGAMRGLAGNSDHGPVQLNFSNFQVQHVWHVTGWDS